MKRGTLVLIFGLLVALTVYHTIWLHKARANPRSVQGRFLRMMKGEPIPDQIKRDCSEDLRAIGLADLQKWALLTMAQYQEGKLDSYSMGGGFLFLEGGGGLYSNNVPGAILRKWRWEKEVSAAVRKEGGHPVCIQLYLTLPYDPRLWVEIGPTNYFRDTNVWSNYSMVAPGIYIFN